MADLRRATPGEELVIPAERYNGFCDVSDWFKGKNDQGGPPGGGQADGTILVRNDTGAIVQRFGILQLDGPVFDPDLANQVNLRVVVKGIVPVDPEGVGIFAVAQMPILDGRVGQCKIVGLTPCKLKMYPQPDEPTIVGDWSWADIEDGQVGNLIVHPGGSAAVIWRSEEDDDDGFRDALVHLSIGSNNATISGIANGACSVDSVGKCTPNYPIGAPDVDYFNALADIDDGARIDIHWERQPKRMCLGPATCSDT